MLAVAACLVSAAVGGVAQARDRTTTARPNATAPVPATIEVDWLLFNGCNCPDRGSNDIAVRVNHHPIFETYGRSEKGDGLYHIPNGLAKTLCTAPNRGCALLTKQHHIRIGPIG